MKILRNAIFLGALFGGVHSSGVCMQFEFIDAPNDECIVQLENVVLLAQSSIITHAFKFEATEDVRLLRVGNSVCFHRQDLKEEVENSFDQFLQSVLDDTAQKININTNNARIQLPFASLPQFCIETFNGYTVDICFSKQGYVFIKPALQ